MKISTTKKAAILATVLSGFVLGGSAEAAKLGIVTASDYATSHMGAIEGSYINSDDIKAVQSVITGLNRDPAVYNTVDQVTGKSSLYIRQYNYSTTNLQNSYAFDAQGKWDEANRAVGNTSGAVNAHDVARHNNYVYVASYDEGTIGIAKVEGGNILDIPSMTVDLKQHLHDYEGITFENENASLHGEGVVILDGALYVIANVNPLGGYTPYNPSYLMKYVIQEDGSLSYDGCTTMGKNTDSVSLNVYNNYMLATAIGGYQYYGAENSNKETSLNVATIHPEYNYLQSSRAINLPENLYTIRNGERVLKSEFRSLKVMPNGTAYVMTYNIGRAGKNVDVTVYQTTISNLLSSNPQNWKEVYKQEAAPGWFGRLDAEQNTNRLWVQVGNKLNIYTDGAANPETFGTDAFAGNQMYEELYTWDIISTDIIPEGNLVKLNVNENKAVNGNAVTWKEIDTKDNIGQLENITQKTIDKKLNVDNLISLNQDDEGNLTNNVLAGIYAEGVTSKVNANDGLQIQVHNTIASPVGIYAGNGGSVKFTGTGGNLDILTQTLEGGNTVTNAIWLDPSKNGGESITITAKETNITMKGGYGGNGIAIEKTERFYGEGAENSKESTQGGKITITGDVNIKGADNQTWGIGANPTNVLSRFNNAGILVDVNNSSVEVNGNVDMDVYGNGVTVTGDNSTVTIKKGGEITVPTGTNYGYYALAAYDGTINMNADATENTVKLNGDIFATKEGTINLGLATKDSYLNGIIDNGGNAENNGAVNVIIKNGATWTNVANNTRYKQDNEDVGYGGNSRVTNLYGADTLANAGTIVQDAEGYIRIDNLDGAVNVVYRHEEENPTNILGGSVTIAKATEGSQIGMYTDSVGITVTDDAQVKDVLNKLANKLYYTAYADGNLTGVVGIKEQLTSSSVAKQVELQFGANGQGTATGDVSEGEGPAPDDIPGGSEVNAFTPVAFPGGTGAQNTDVAWKDSGAQSALRFDKSMTYSNSSGPLQIQAEDGNSAIYVGTGVARAIIRMGTNEPVNVIAKVNDDGRMNAIWLDPSSKGGENLRIMGAESNDLNISVIGNGNINGVAISRADGSKDVAAKSSIMVQGNLTIKGQYDNQWGIGANTTNYDARENNSGILVDANNGNVTIMGTNSSMAGKKGYVDMAVYGNGITVDGNNASVDVGFGGKIIVPTDTVNNLNYYSLAAYDGSIKFGFNDINNVRDSAIEGYSSVVGNLLADSSTATVYLGLNGKSSGELTGLGKFEGAIINNNGGTVNLALSTGATWTNISNNTNEIGAISRVSKLFACYDVWEQEEEDISKIVQTADSGDIIIRELTGSVVNKGNYIQYNPGDLIVEYNDYDGDSPTVIKGGSIVIESATKGTTLTVKTRYSDSITKDNLQNVMNSLANKVYYTGARYLVNDEGYLRDRNGNYCDNEGNVYTENDVLLGNVHNGFVFNADTVDYNGGLNATVQIAEGLIRSSITANILEDGKVPENIANIECPEGVENKITFNNGTLNAGVIWNGTTGQGSLTGKFEDGTGAYEEGAVGNKGFINENGAYTKPIYGQAAKDVNYRGAGILTDSGVYEFTDAVNVFETNNHKIEGGAWHSPVGVAISALGEGNVTKINLNNNDLIITNTTSGSGSSITAIDGGKVEINNVGDIIINEKGQGPTGGIFANSGGVVEINNAGGGTVTIRTAAGGEDNLEQYKEYGACIKTLNGVGDVRSKVVITGMVDLVADSNTCNNEAISAVASTIEVGGGNIQAINGAWAAIRAYGEFVSNNSGVVNVNVVKQYDENGNILKDTEDFDVDLIAGAGDNETTIVGDFVTNGGMGSKGVINVGLSGTDCYWIGNYGDTRGYGVTKGMEGEVNLYMKEGATWTGFNDGQMNVTMEGEGTTWYGFNLCDVTKFEGTYSEGENAKPYSYYAGGLDLTLKDSALWINAISTQQKDNNGNQANSLIKNFVGDDGFIDMTGSKTFLAINSANHADGSNGTSLQNTKIQEYGDKYETGNLVISNYSGDTTVIYRHDNENVTNILGGTTTIKKAAAGSNITLSTDSTGIDSNDTDLVTMVLNKLAHKLFYTAYTTGEDNLKGKVQIAEGLTTSSVGKYFGEIKFDANNKGQGSMKDGSLTKPGNTPIVPPSGDEDDKDDEQQGGTTTPEQPEQKPVVTEKFEGSVDSSNLENLENDETFGSVVTAEHGKLDFGKLDKDEHGNDKPASEHVDIVKVEGGVKHTDPATPFVWDMDDKGLSVGGKTEVTGGTFEIQNAGDVTLKGNTEVKGDVTNKGVLKIDNKENGGKVIFEGAKGGTAPVLSVSGNAEVNVSGKVEIVNTNGKVAVEVAKDSTVALGGGVIGDEGTVAIAVKDGGSIEINKEGGQSVVINGKILLGNPQSKMMMKVAPKAIEVPAGASSFNLTDDRSSMNDDVQYTGTGNNDFVAGISNGAKWTGNSVGGVDLDVILADGGAWTGYHEDDNSTAKLDMQISNGATWTNTATDATTVDTMSGDGGFVKMSEDANAGLTIKDYSGATTFIYRHNADNDILGGNVTINKAADGSIVNVRTNSIGTSDKEEVTKVLQALAAKMIAGNNAKTVLKGEAQIAEGIVTSASALKVGNIDFANGTGVLDEKSITAKYDDSDYIYGDSETAMMKGAKSAMASTVMMWRSESNDLLQRMGDVRLATEESGVWAKYYGGKYEMDAQNTNFSTNYKAYQVGYDKAVGNGWNVGVAVSHNEGDSRYDRGGEGEMTVTSLSVYGNKDYGDGRYLGLILKGSQLKNEYEVFNNDGYKLEGDFKTWGTSISAEYGKRIEKGNGFYFDPSVELTIGHVQGKDYTATSDMLAAYGKTATMQVEQDDFNSIIGRVGFGIGQRTDKASYYAKLALAHEFGGDFDTHYTAEETKGTNIDFGDTWYEMQLGGTAKLSDNSLLYATYERSFGGDVTEKWRVDAGLRVTF